MGCFLGCFKGPKDPNRSKEAKRSLPVAKEAGSFSYLSKSTSPRQIISEAAVTAADNTLPEQKTSFLHTEKQEQGLVANVRKKVTFDLNVTTYDNVLVLEGSKDNSDNEQIEIKEEDKNKEEEKEKTDSPKLSAFPTNHRYQNCESSDDEGLDEERGEGDDYEESDFGEEDDGVGINGIEESYDSFFSLPLENEKQNFIDISSPEPHAAPITDMEAIVGTPNARDRSRYVYAVLNPVENLSHWREVKALGAVLKNTRKENIEGEIKTQMFTSPDPTIKAEKLIKPLSSDPNPNPIGGTQKEIAVDASLSNWLISPKPSESSPSKPSLVSPEEQPILGALTMEDIKLSSRTSSPRRSPSRSPDEIPILGIVGSYWSSKSREDSASSWSSVSDIRGIPNSTSKYKEACCRTRG